MDLRMLGPLEVWDGSHQLPIDSRTQCALLAALAIHRNEVVSTDRIIDELWGDDPPSSPLQTLRYHVSKLRSALGDAAVYVVTRSPGYMLEVDQDAIDVHRFESMAAEGRGLIAAEPERAARVLVDALGMWRGSPLVDFEYESFARGEITRLEELRLSVVEDRIDADLASRRHQDLVGEIQALVVEHPLRERLWGQLMTALYRSGRQVEALRAYEEACRVFGEIGIEPSAELQSIEEQVLLQDPLLLPPRSPKRRHNLPERLSSFIGRGREIEEIDHMVNNHRLVTLTGVGGVGKTSLAVEVARSLIGDYSDGVWFVATSDVAHAELIPERLAHILGVHIRTPEGLVDQLGAYLSERAPLLVFDGCERHIDGVARLVEPLLSAAPKLRVIATSRELLEVVGESRLEVPVLDTDGVKADAVRLFEDRASLVQPGFEITSGNIDVVTRICRRVAGIPLAVELAAARLGALSLDQIGQRLDDQMTLLARGRSAESPHGSLQAVLDWSHALLDHAQQILLRRLAVFEDGCTLEAAEQVCSDCLSEDRALFDSLTRLVDVSLVVLDRGTSRFELLDPVRQYAAGRLDAAGETSQIQRRHATYYRDLARSAFDGVFGPDEVKWFGVCVQEESNHVAAIAWALNDEPILAVHTAAYLSIFWTSAAFENRFLAPLLSEARKYASLESVILLTHASYSGLLRGTVSVSLAEEALQVAGQLDDEFALGYALHRLGVSVGWDEDFDLGAEYVRKACRLFDRIGHPKAMDCLFNLAFMLVRIEDESGALLAEAEAAAQELLVRSRELPSLRHEADAYQALGWVALFRGDLERVRSYLLAAIPLHEQLHGNRWIAQQMHILAEVELATGNVDRAVAYHEEYGPLFKEIWGGVYLPLDGMIQIAVGDVERGIATLLEALSTFADRSERVTVDVLVALSAACTEIADPATASRLYAAAQAMRERNRLALAPHQALRLRDNCVRLRSTLDDDRFEQEWAKGEAMNVEEVVAYARGALQPTTVT